jgi:hypothetical protein
MTMETMNRRVTRAGFAAIAREHGWEERTIDLITKTSTPNMPPILIGQWQQKASLSLLITDWPQVPRNFAK